MTWLHALPLISALRRRNGNPIKEVLHIKRSDRLDFKKRRIIQTGEKQERLWISICINRCKQSVEVEVHAPLEGKLHIQELLQFHNRLGLILCVDLNGMPAETSCRVDVFRQIVEENKLFWF